MATQNRPLPAVEIAKAEATRTILDIYDTPFRERAFDPDLATESALDAHEADLANPHQVTAVQVGALPLIGGTMTGACGRGT